MRRRRHVVRLVGALEAPVLPKLDHGCRLLDLFLITLVHAFHILNRIHMLHIPQFRFVYSLLFNLIEI